jgi:hypothetical protein
VELLLCRAIFQCGRSSSSSPWRPPSSSLAATFPCRLFAHSWSRLPPLLVSRHGRCPAELCPSRISPLPTVRSLLPPSLSSRAPLCSAWSFPHRRAPVVSSLRIAISSWLPCCGRPGSHTQLKPPFPASSSLLAVELPSPCSISAPAARSSAWPSHPWHWPLLGAPS